MKATHFPYRIATLLCCLVLTACSKEQMPNQELAEYVDLERFMGTWYVHGHTPTFMDKQAFAATESYELEADGTIKTTYRYRKGSLEGKEKTFHPLGKVYNQETNAEWRMRFFGVINAPYYILYVDAAYQNTVVGHPDKKMAWIMSRSPEMPDSQYESLKAELTQRDYELSKLRKIPHR